MRNGVWKAAQKALLNGGTGGLPCCRPKATTEATPAINGVAFTGEDKLVRKATGYEGKAEATLSQIGFAGSASELRRPLERIGDPQISPTRPKWRPCRPSRPDWSTTKRPLGRSILAKFEKVRPFTSKTARDPCIDGLAGTPHSLASSTSPGFKLMASLQSYCMQPTHGPNLADDFRAKEVKNCN
jgi:hypothetical protein